MAFSVKLIMGRIVNTNITAPITSPMSQNQAQTNTNLSQNNATLELISSLVFAESKSVRTSTLILVAFNVIASFATAASIVYDCYWASKRSNPKFKASRFFLSSIHPAETFPLILAIGVVIQGLVFAGVQGQGMQSLFTGGCEVTAQFMFPALFIVPYIQVVFGLECALRSLRKQPFHGRGKHDATICGTTVLLMLIGTWLPTFLFQEPRQCFASLVWFISRYGTLGLLILSIVGGLMVISALTIFIRLSTTAVIEQHERISSSRMVYYLVLGIVSLALVIPYFVSQIHGESGELKLAMMATVVLNLSGLMNGLLQLFLRSNTATTSFGPTTGRSWDHRKHEIRMWGPNELAFGNHLTDPVSGPQTSQTVQNRSESRASLLGAEKISMDALRSPSPGTLTPTQQMTFSPTIPEPIKEAQESSYRRHCRNQSYSLFPSKKVELPPQQKVDVGSVYDNSPLEPPTINFFGASKGHKRDSSIVSSATVQIGMRLSHAPDSPGDLGPLSLPSTTYDPSRPPPTYLNVSLSPMAFTNSTPRPKSPSPLKLQTTNLTSASPLRSPKRPSPVMTKGLSPEHSPVRVDKDLPPTPIAALAPALKGIVRESSTQLSPTVYSPSKEKKNEAKEEKRVINGLPSGPKCGGSPLKRSGNGLGSLKEVPQRSISGRLPIQAQSERQRKDWI